MVEKTDLGLSLSLRFPDHRSSSLHLNLMPSPFNRSKTSWNDNFPFLDRDSETRSFVKGIDVNRLPSAAEGEDDFGVSSPNSTISSVSGKKSERDVSGDDNERACSGGISDHEDGGDASRKKLRLSKDQSAVLEESFKEHNTLHPKQKLALAKRLGLRSRQVEVWFQNRRARTKLKQTEVDCDFLKRCCENLTDENRRLQKEVQELRALKLSPQFYMQMAPPTTLTMCPSCESMGPPSSAPSAPPRSHQVDPTITTHHQPSPFYPWAAANATTPVSHQLF
ncbi:Homeobox-leucine zipper protein [Actinidia chinensis var. chinensis]|uniref:Homeobox-leucine zipper protein n=1 Tax=Actinidia chinensis var. chinensis TaxID=1590841 RepID=A0A2R6QNQ5_ACTCC|nr:Homeobox-leucine zipper protein [Actinidia chinensis var. chinensis]